MKTTDIHFKSIDMKSMISAALLSLFLLGCSTRGTVEAPDGSRLAFLIDHLRDSLPATDYVMVAAHRGDWIWAPENSLKGIQNCIEIGVDIIEVDVRSTRDSVLVLLHDETLDRTTTGSGRVSEWSLNSLKRLRLLDATGVKTDQIIPTLGEVLDLAKGKALLFLDKTQDKIPAVLDLVEQKGMLNQAVFILDLPYRQARKAFGNRLEKVFYFPVVGEGIDSLDTYVNDFLTHYKPAAFQFRIPGTGSPLLEYVSRVSASGAKPLVAATWADHSMQRGDQASRRDPEQGWGWLLSQGFTLLETNHPYDLIEYLDKKGQRNLRLTADE